MLELGRDDPRITGGAVTGSLSVGAEDRWSDIDTSFGVRDDVDPATVLADWTDVLERELGILHHWDLRHGPTIYRVFLVPGGLELDIAVTPASEFGARGPKFQLQFGEAEEREAASPPSFDELAGYGWLYALTGRAAVERGKAWAAEYWISAVRDYALALACLRLGERTDYARGVDSLPPEVTAPYEEALVGSLGPDDLRRGLALVTSLFLDEVSQADASLAERLRIGLRELVTADE